MIEISERFDVPAPPSKVWGMLSDPSAVVGCVPGAALGESHEDGSFDGSITVKFGPAKVAFKARIELELDAATMTGKVSSRGKDNQGGTRVRANMTFNVAEQAGQQGSTVEIKGDVEVSGRLASLVETGAGFVVKRMTADFAERLAAHCAAGVAATPAQD